MKTVSLHILSIFLLVAVGYTSLTHSELVGEKERYELGDSFEEGKEGKSLWDFPFDLAGYTHFSWELPSAYLHIENCLSPNHLKGVGNLPERYILYCNLKLHCC